MTDKPSPRTTQVKRRARAKAQCAAIIARYERKIRRAEQNGDSIHALKVQRGRALAKIRRQCAPKPRTGAKA